MPFRISSAGSGVETMAEGDVYITNDPWEGTGHLHDITVVTPSFKAGVLVGFFACTAHIVDIGGRGFGADANSVYEEGLYIPIMKLMDRGAVDADADAHHPRQRSRARSTGRRHLRAGDLQRDWSPPPDRDDGGIRPRRPQEIAAFILDNSRRATLEKPSTRCEHRAGRRRDVDRRLQQPDHGCGRRGQH